MLGWRPLKQSAVDGRKARSDLTMHSYLCYNPHLKNGPLLLSHSYRIYRIPTVMRCPRVSRAIQDRVIETTSARLSGPRRKTSLSFTRGLCNSLYTRLCSGVLNPCYDLQGRRVCFAVTSPHCITLLFTLTSFDLSSRELNVMKKRCTGERPSPASTPCFVSPVVGSALSDVMVE